MLLRLLLVTTLVGPLLACTTAAQRDARAIKDAVVSTSTQATACITAVNSDPAFAELNRHFPLNDVRQASLAQQADPSFATPQEIELLSMRHEKLTPCRKIVTDGLAAVPTIDVVWMEFYAKSDAILLELAKRKINWGEFITRGKSLAEGLQPQLVAEAREIETDLNSRHQQELAQRAAAAQAFSNALYQQQLLNQNQQMINNMNRPTTTTCNRFGATVNCTSYY